MRKYYDMLAWMYEDMLGIDLKSDSTQIKY